MGLGEWRCGSETADPDKTRGYSRKVFFNQGNCQVNYFSKKGVKAIVKSIVRPKKLFMVIVISFNFPKSFSRHLSNQLCDQKYSSR